MYPRRYIKESGTRASILKEQEINQESGYGAQAARKETGLGKVSWGREVF